jgi:hypothetical protein
VIRHRRVGAFGIGFWLMAIARVGAEPATTIRSNGPASNRVDLVVLGDGYTAGDLLSGKYAKDVEAAVVGMFAQNPYTEYQRYYNVVRIDVTSAESGADHPAQGVFRNTALDAAYDCSGIQRLICVNTSKVNAVLTASIAAPNARDVILVLVNDPEYGGSGGSVAVASIDASAVEIVLHEVGHSFASLADEYTSQPPPCNNSIEPSAANVTRETSRPSIKWNVWIDPSTPVPTPGTAETPGLYEGAQYCPTGLYRPTFNSKMRSLGRPFSAINTEAHIKRLYNFVTPLDSSAPVGPSITLPKGSEQLASVSVPQPFTHSLTIDWTVDGVPAGSGTSFILRTVQLSVGQHMMSVTITDGTPMVRNDPSHLLTVVRTWTVTVTPSFTDYPLQPGVSVSAVHVTELRSRINDLRVRCGLAMVSFTDTPLLPGITPARAVHVTELRTALDQAYAARGLPSFPYSDPMLVGTTIRAVHISELREAVLSLESTLP